MDVVVIFFLWMVEERQGFRIYTYIFFFVFSRELDIERISLRIFIFMSGEGINCVWGHLTVIE